MPGGEAPHPHAGPTVGHLTTEVPAQGESFHPLASVAGAFIEHIVSSDAADPALQVQGWDEWVLVVAGSARLEVAGEAVDLTAGHWILLPAGTPHRVLRTQTGTHWIAVHGRAVPAP